MNTPLISVIVPCFNQARYLPDCLDSVFAQTYPHWECIVVNDGSTDDTRQVALACASKDSRFRYVEQNNRGLSGARNRGLNEIRGSYVQFLDSDDAIGPEKLQLQLEAIADVEGLSLVYCDYFYASQEDVTKRADRIFPPPRFVMEKPLWDIASRWETELSIPVHCFLLDARIFTDRGIRFDEKLPNHEDWECWMQVFALEVTAKHVPRELAAYRIHGQAMSADHDGMWQGFSAAIAKQQKIWRLDPVMSRLLAQKMKRTRIAYGKDPVHDVLTSFSRTAAFKRYVPWRGQEFIRRILKRKVPIGGSERVSTDCRRPGGGRGGGGP